MEEQYLDLLRDIMANGIVKNDPHGVGSKGVFVRTMRFRLDQGVFPVITTKKVFWKSALHELLWFLSGESTLDYFHKHGLNFWDQWATEDKTKPYGRKPGDVGPIYGPNWRHWEVYEKWWYQVGRIFFGKKFFPKKEIDQIKNLIIELKKNPDYRRHKAITWNPAYIDKLFLAPCHGDIKCFAANGKLSLHLNQRSGDVPVGVAFNIIQYAALTMMLAQLTSLEPHEFVHTIEDAHIYLDQLNFAEEQLSRKPYSLPTLEIDPKVSDIDKFKIEHFKLINYQHHDFIDYPVAT